MAYKTYTTDALVIGSEDRLTADRMFSLFTREAGLVYARAVSVRRERSRLRYSLQDFSFVRVSLVRGKQGWRVTGAEGCNNLYFCAEARHTRAALLRVLQLVRRLVRGEETHIELYDILVDGLAAISASVEAEIARTELVLTLRILSVLGYVAPKDSYRSLLVAPSLEEALLHARRDVRQEKMIKTAIGDALAASHL